MESISETNKIKALSSGSCYEELLKKLASDLCFQDKLFNPSSFYPSLSPKEEKISKESYSLAIRDIRKSIGKILMEIEETKKEEEKTEIKSGKSEKDFKRKEYQREYYFRVTKIKREKERKKKKETIL